MWGKGMLPALVVASGMGVLGAVDQVSAAGTQPAAPATPAAAPGKTPARAGASVHYVPSLPVHARMYYQGVWGVDSLHVKTAESGELIRFSWQVLDPAKAAVLNDKQVEPALIDLRAGVSLVVPQMEKVGKFRQSSTPEAGRSYWMAFSNKGRLVKRGDRVSVVIGPFRAEGLVVE
jgi:hypothetical protein